MSQFGCCSGGFSPAQPSKCRPEGRRYGKLAHYRKSADIEDGSTLHLVVGWRRPQ